MRFRFILGLVILGASLQFIGKTLRGVLPIMQEAAQYPAGKQMLRLPAARPVPPTANLPTDNTLSLPPVLREVKERFKKPKHVKLINPADKQNGPAYPEGSAFMQITLEDKRPPLRNKYLGEEASARLDAFLRTKREQNALLADETGTLFGEEAKKEIIKKLTDDERESLENARTSKTAKEYAARQEKTDAKTNAQLAEIFEKYKTQFNRRLNKNSPAWNDFFKRVNNFQKAED